MAFPTDPIYKLLKNPLGVVDCVMKQTGSSEPYNLSTIPFAEDNTDYQEFLKWKADGGVPEEAD
jgi:hypothetical protein|tara:strand:+ start:1002 stop:1193 length:192 start_codon:yes stop_codon:yes gene_type:complete